VRRSRHEGQRRGAGTTAPISPKRVRPDRLRGWGCPGAAGVGVRPASRSTGRCRPRGRGAAGQDQAQVRCCASTGFVDLHQQGFFAGVGGLRTRRGGWPRALFHLREGMKGRRMAALRRPFRFRAGAECGWVTPRACAGLSRSASVWADDHVSCSQANNCRGRFFFAKRAARAEGGVLARQRTGPRSDSSEARFSILTPARCGCQWALNGRRARRYPKGKLVNANPCAMRWRQDFAAGGGAPDVTRNVGASGWSSRAARDHWQGREAFATGT